MSGRLVSKSTKPSPERKSTILENDSDQRNVARHHREVLVDARQLLIVDVIVDDARREFEKIFGLCHSPSLHGGRRTRKAVYRTVRFHRSISILLLCVVGRAPAFRFHGEYDLPGDCASLDVPVTEFVAEIAMSHGGASPPRGWAGRVEVIGPSTLTYL